MTREGLGSCMMVEVGDTDGEEEERGGDPVEVLLSGGEALKGRVRD
jgi:hypothetical protein